MKKTKTYWIIAILLVIVFSIFLLKPNNKLYPAELVTHGHGLAVDIEDPSKLYIATHHGLMMMLNDKELYRIGKREDDYMGFSIHPTNSKMFFSSGHPELGGNLGFQISENAGFTWKKISNGLNGPVDFHAMAVSHANPNIIYGWFANSLQRSLDRGETWKLIPTNLLTLAKGSGVYSLIADPKDENKVYAATGVGLFSSGDKGESWILTSEKLKDVAIISFAINPGNPLEMLSFTPRGLAKSTDSGATWNKIEETFENDFVFYIAYSKINSETVYVLTKKNLIYKSLDGGSSWAKIL
ncbi:MAG: hypothetical protein Q8R00_01610 [Candidatus Nanoarchaeia archaeon]|nr:hypothetical protein [Candidatus Nanoarchaeia archaeon]